MALNFDLARKRRRYLELTQAQVGEAVGVTGVTISRWENGEREPRSTELVAWAMVLGLQPADLFADADPAPAAKAATS